MLTVRALMSPPANPAVAARALAESATKGAAVGDGDGGSGDGQRDDLAEEGGGGGGQGVLGVDCLALGARSNVIGSKSSPVIEVFARTPVGSTAHLAAPASPMKRSLLAAAAAAASSATVGSKAGGASGSPAKAGGGEKMASSDTLLPVAALFESHPVRLYIVKKKRTGLERDT